MSLTARSHLSIAAMLFGCAGPSADSSTSERVDSAGVTIIWNTSTDKELAWDFVELFRLGGADSGPGAFYRVTDSNVAVDGSGHIYVLDAANFRVVVFDSLGQFRRMFGTEGGGPGEFLWPGQIAVSPQGSVSVYDIRKQAFVRFDQLGFPVDQYSSAAFGLVQRHAVYRDSLILQTSPLRPDRGARVQRLILVTAQDTVTVATHSSEPARTQTYDGCGVRIGLPPIFTKSLQWRHTPRAVAVSAEASYVVTMFVRGRSMSIRRLVRTRAATPDLARRELGEGMPLGVGGDRACMIPTATLIEQRGVASEVPAIRDLALSPNGHLWIKRWRFADEPAKTDVFDRDGSYVGTLTGDEPFPVTFLPGGRFLSVVTDDVDVQRLVAYRIIDRGSGAH